MQPSYKRQRRALPPPHPSQISAANQHCVGEMFRQEAQFLCFLELKDRVQLGLVSKQYSSQRNHNTKKLMAVLWLAVELFVYATDQLPPNNTVYPDTTIRNQIIHRITPELAQFFSLFIDPISLCVRTKAAAYLGRFLFDNANTEETREFLHVLRKVLICFDSEHKFNTNSTYAFEVVTCMLFASTRTAFWPQPTNFTFHGQWAYTGLASSLGVHNDATQRLRAAITKMFDTTTTTSNTTSLIWETFPILKREEDGGGDYCEQDWKRKQAEEAKHYSSLSYSPIYHTPPPWPTSKQQHAHMIGEDITNFILDHILSGIEDSECCYNDEAYHINKALFDLAPSLSSSSSSRPNEEEEEEKEEKDNNNNNLATAASSLLLQKAKETKIRMTEIVCQELWNNYRHRFNGHKTDQHLLKFILQCIHSCALPGANCKHIHEKFDLEMEEENKRLASLPSSFANLCKFENWRGEEKEREKGEKREEDGEETKENETTKEREEEEEEEAEEEGEGENFYTEEEEEAEGEGEEVEEENTTQDN